MDRPDISVIITSYNVERYIERAIASALNQQGVTLEIIVADDASTDNTWSLISPSAHPQVKSLRLETNGGPSVARNAAIAQVTGEWIAVLDGDDEFLPGRLARCLRRARAQNADIVVDNLRIHREADNKEFPMFPATQFSGMQRLDLAAFIAGNHLFSGSYTLGYLKPLFSTDFLRKHTLSYDPAIRIGEDYILLAEALASGANCVIEPEEGYQYTVRSGSISHRLALDDITRMFECDAKLLARYSFPPAAAQAQQERENRLKKAYAFTLLVEAIKRKDMKGAWKAVTSCPGCIWLLWMPVEARLQRLFKHFTG